MKIGNKLPVIFVGHGAPNILLHNDPILKEWSKQVDNLHEIKRILIISAHWETQNFTVSGNHKQTTIHDFSGFPKELSEINYSPPRDTIWATELAKKSKYKQR